MHHGEGHNPRVATLNMKGSRKGVVTLGGTLGAGL